MGLSRRIFMVRPETRGAAALGTKQLQDSISAMNTFADVFMDACLIDCMPLIEGLQRRRERDGRYRMANGTNGSKSDPPPASSNPARRNSPADNAARTT